MDQTQVRQFKGTRLTVPRGQQAWDNKQNKNLFLLHYLSRPLEATDIFLCDCLPNIQAVTFWIWVMVWVEEGFGVIGRQ